MMGTQAFGHKLGLSRMHAVPIVFVVDDDVSVRESLELLIRCEGWEPQTFASALEFLARPRAVVPSCLVLDISLPGLNGLDLQKQIAVERPRHADHLHYRLRRCSEDCPGDESGSVEFLTKPFSDVVLLSAIRQAVERSETTLDQAAEMRTLRDRYASLSGREREVMALVVAGLLNKQVGNDLGISEITVKAHRGRMMQKMKADSLAALVIMAARLGLTSAPKAQ
jgi:FixJ family two-component response regulator